MMPPRRLRPKVLHAAPPPRFESGDELPAGVRFDKVVIMAHFTSNPELSRSVRTLSTQFRDAGYHVIIMSSSDLDGPLRWEGEIGVPLASSPGAAAPHGISIYRRANIGYDFGSWAAGLDAFPNLAHAHEVILCNDSLVGPFAPIAPILKQFESSQGDIWGLTDSTHIAHHVQSFWVGYRGGVLAQPPLRDFWREVRVEQEKSHIIKRYEVGAMRYWRRHGYAVEVGFPYELVVRDGFNPASFGWRRLLHFGFPFVKREIAVNPPAEILDGDQVAEVVAARFGADLRDWL
jgi:hypothetical protein